MKGVAILALALAPGPALACALELILAVDVSGSIDGDEWRLQSEGMATAFEDPQVIQAIETMEGGMIVTYTQWSGTSRQRQVTPWMKVDSTGTAAAFAGAIRGAGRTWRNFSTAVGDALTHAGGVSGTAPAACKRKVIDISGDGISNEGENPLYASRRLEAAGHTVNALVIRGANPDPVVHYRELVLAGPGAFVEIAEGFEDFPRAFRRKLFRELDQNLLISER